jgi:hypothetical protein
MEDNGLGMSESEIAALNQKNGEPIQHNIESYGRDMLPPLVEGGGFPGCIS